MPIELLNELDQKCYHDLKDSLDKQAAVRAMHLFKHDPTKFWKVLRFVLRSL